MGLELRFTEAETSLASPDLAAFAAVDHALLREQQAEHDDISPLGDLAAASLIAARMRIVDAEPSRAQVPVFVSQRHWPIPPISAVPEAVPEAPAVDAFVLADHAHGHFAWPQPQRPRSRVGAALVLAACIPMFLPDTAAAQQPIPQQPVAQQPAAAMIPPAPAPAPVVRPPPPTSPVAPNFEEAPTPARPEQPSLQAVLYAMKGHEAVVYVGDRRITGLIIGVDGGFVMMVDENRDGRIAMIPREQITDVRGKTGIQPRAGLSGVALPPDGTGLLAGGGVLAALGAPLFISGVVFVAITPSFTPLWMPQLLPALVFLGAGIPMLVGGSRRRRAYQEALYGARLGQRITPSFGRTPGGGWTGGLSLRF